MNNILLFYTHMKKNITSIDQLNIIDYDNIIELIVVNSNRLNTIDIPKLPNLKILSIHNFNNINILLLPNLEILHIQGSISNIINIDILPKLQILSLYFIRNSNINIPLLPKLTQLYLHFCNNINLCNIHNIDNLISLKIVDCDYVRIPTILPKLQKLTYIYDNKPNNLYDLIIKLQNNINIKKFKIICDNDINNDILDIPIKYIEYYNINVKNNLHIKYPYNIINKYNNLPFMIISKKYKYY